MIVYLNSNGTIQQVVPQNLTQGSNNQDLIVIGENLSNFTALSAVFKLPNKQVLAPILMTKQQSDYVINNEIVNVWTCSLTEAVTNFSGTLELTINASAGGTITNSYTGAVQIAPTNAPSFPTIDQSAVEVFNQIAEAYAYITGQLDNKQDKLDESLETTDKTVVGGINELNAKETQNAGDIVDLQSEVEDLHEDIDDIQDGTISVGRASADQNGDNIVNTYQKKADSDLGTVNKTVVGGINELKDQAVLNAENIQNANQEITDIKDDYATKVYVDNALAGITIGGAKTLVFDTEQDFLDWLGGTYQRADGKTPSVLNIGDAILIKEQDVPDWWVSSKSDPMTINDFTEYEVKIEVGETKIDNDSITNNADEELQAVKLKNAFTNIDTTVTKSDFSGATKLSKEQYYELLQYGQIEVDGQIITFSEGEFYITPDLSEDFDDRITELETTVTELTPEVARALKTPMTAPISTELVAVDTANGQAMITVGDGLVIENDTLKSTGGVQIVDNLTSTSISAALSANQGRVLNTMIGTKANQSDLDNLETTVSTKANQSALDSTNANVTSNSNQIGTLATEVANKANQSALNSTNSQVSTNTSNIASLNTNKANKDLSNVTYPQVVADGVAKTGAGDRVIERYVSSDGATWYEIYESGWKRCGGYLEGTGGEVEHFMPITFSNTQPNKQYTLIITPHSYTNGAGHTGHTPEYNRFGYGKTANSFKYAETSGFYLDYVACGY